MIVAPLFAMRQSRHFPLLQSPAPARGPALGRRRRPHWGEGGAEAFYVGDNLWGAICG